MKTRLHHRIISFGSCFLLTSAFGYPVYAAPSKDQIDNHARANGFPRSDYPYYEPVNQCGGEGVTSKVPDKYELKVLGRVVFRADFREACNNHDRCYMTAGSNRRECDANFERDLKSRCGSVAKNPGCHAFAKPYAEVVYNVGGEFFPNAQAKARNYKSLVQNFIAQSSCPENNITIRPTSSNLEFRKGMEWNPCSNYKFIFQNDGNLVLYGRNGAIWATGTNNRADLFVVQADGNVVLYGGGRAVWSTNTGGNSGAFLAIQSDGNLVVYGRNQNVLWSTGTGGR